ncbi:dienelactone hydrolase family protein [Minwuia sp.]|uniref:dienelactone hydrolase family protein n=1 Tax=Minwuia sp. TaxID=2493630 RepID=UPI003A8E9A6D
MREHDILLKTADGEMDCFVCHPEEGGPHPAAIIYMDAPGIREELRDMARRMATVGYYVMLPNMYYRTGREGHYGFDLARIRTDDDERKKMFAVMNSLSNALVVSDTQPMLEYIRQTDAAAPGPVGITGYCMSGQYVVAVAAAFPEDVAAAASFYGVGIITDRDDSPHLSADRIRGELYLAFAEEDQFVPDAILEELPGVMRKAGVDCRVEIYPGTEHGFAFPERAVYVKQAGERHWERIFALFDRKLRAR